MQLYYIIESQMYIVWKFSSIKGDRFQIEPILNLESRTRPKGPIPQTGNRPIGSNLILWWVQEPAMSNPALKITPIHFFFSSTTITDHNEDT